MMLITRDEFKHQTVIRTINLLPLQYSYHFSILLFGVLSYKTSRHCPVKMLTYPPVIDDRSLLFAWIGPNVLIQMLSFNSRKHFPWKNITWHQHGISKESIRWLLYFTQARGAFIRSQFWWMTFLPILLADPKAPLHFTHCSLPSPPNLFTSSWYLINHLKHMKRSSWHWTDSLIWPHVHANYPPIGEYIYLLVRKHTHNF